MTTRAEIIEDQRMAILIAIRDGSTRDKWLTAIEIGEITGLSDQTIKRRLKSLSCDGRIYHSVHRKRTRTGVMVKYYRWQLMPEVRRTLEKGMR